MGEKPKQGKRSDLDAIKERIDEGASIIDVAHESFGSFLRYRNGFRDYICLTQPQRDFMPNITVLWGPPGTGKTFRAFNAAKDAGSYFFLPRPSSKGGSLWFDGYASQDILIIDEFYGWILHDFLLRLLDRYPLTIQVKGSSAPMVSKDIVITSNVPPWMWYSSPHLSYRGGPLERRLSLPTSSVMYMGLQQMPEGVEGPALYTTEEAYLEQLATAAEYRDEAYRQRLAARSARVGEN